MKVKAWVEFTYTIHEALSRSADRSEQQPIPGTNLSFFVWGTMADPGETSVRWHPDWQWDPTNGYDYTEKSISGFHFSQPQDSGAKAPGFSGYYWEPNKYVVYYVDRSDVPPGLDLGGVDDLVAAGFVFGENSASISLGDLNARGSATLDLTNALGHIAREAANALGAGRILDTALRIESLRDTLQGFMGDALDVLEDGIANFERINPAEYSDKVDRLLRDSSERFLAEVETQLGSSGHASTILRTVNILGDVSAGKADVELAIGRSVEMIGPGILVLSAEAGIVIGSSGRDVVINQGEHGGGPSWGHGAYLGVPFTARFDAMNLRGGSDAFIGFQAREHVLGGGGNDFLAGGGGADLLRGGWGNDRVFGGAGRDALEGGPGRDIIVGGGGIDSADYRASSGHVSVNLKAGTGRFNDAQGDVLRQISNIGGSAFDDALTGNAAANEIWGRDGDDRIIGAGGADGLRGGNGNDFLLAGPGADTLYGGPGNDRLAGRVGPDTFVFFDGDSSKKSPAFDVIMDFDPGFDLIMLSGAAFSILTKQDILDRVVLSKTGGDTIIDLSDINGQRIEVRGIRDLHADDFL